VFSDKGSDAMGLLALEDCFSGTSAGFPGIPSRGNCRRGIFLDSSCTGTFLEISGFGSSTTFVDFSSLTGRIISCIFGGSTTVELLGLNGASLGSGKSFGGSATVTLLSAANDLGGSGSARSGAVSLLGVFFS